MQNLFPLYPAALFQILLHCDAVYKLHDYVFHIVAAADIIYGNNIWVRKHCNSIGLRQKAASELLVLGHFLSHYLYCNVSPKPVTERLIDDSHSALAYPLIYFISVIKKLTDIFIFIFHKLSPISSRPEQ